MGGVRAVTLAALLLAGALAGAGTARAATATSTVEDRIAVTVHAPDGAIDDLRGGRLLLVVRNLAEEDLALEAVRPIEGVSEDGLRYTFEQGTGCRAGDADESEEALVLPCTVPPAGQALVPIGVVIEALSRSGKTVAAFDVLYRHGDDAGNVVAVADLTLGVFGESDVAPLLQVPSILVLPGVLFLVVLTLLWRLGTRPAGREPGDFPVKAGDLEYWIVAGVLSIGLVTAWLLTGRNLLRGYGYRDLRDLALVAVGLAVATGLALSAARYAAQRDERKAREREASRTLLPGDRPEVGLAKLARWDRTADLSRPSVSVDGKELVLYHAPEDGAAVVGPQLALVYTDDTPVKVREEIQTLRSAGKIAPLARRVERAAEQGHVTVTWAGGGDVRTVAAGDYTDAGKKPVILWRQD